MKNIIFIFISILFINSCGKENNCNTGDTIILTKHRNSIKCNCYNVGFLIKSQEQIDKMIDSLPCSTYDDYAEPLNFNKTWMIGYSSMIDYDKYTTGGELYKDTCTKTVTYNFIMTYDSTSDLIDNSGQKAVEIRYCLVSAFPSDYKVVFNKEVRYEKLP